MLLVRYGMIPLCFINGKFFLYVTCEVPEPPIKKRNKVLGVDMGIKNVATLSDGINFGGGKILAIRKRNKKLRDKLDKKRTKSARRKIKRNHREHNFATNENHIISKQIVSIAKGTNSMIALENLSGINEQLTVRKKQRAKQHSWTFFQLRLFIEYKAKLAGVRVILVDAHYTSQRCFECSHIDKRNRKSQSKFKCVNCGHTNNADINGAKNIAFLARPSSTGLKAPSRFVKHEATREGSIPELQTIIER
jgi:putative transposase